MGLLQFPNFQAAERMLAKVLFTTVKKKWQFNISFIDVLVEWES